MNILPEIKLPGPAIIGQISLPALEAPPLQLPSKPSANGSKAIQHAIGADIADFADTILEAIPGIDIVGAILDPVRDSLQDMHSNEIYNLLDKDEYRCYLKYNKIFPSTIAAVRCTCFQPVRTKTPAGKVTGLAKILPMNPLDGPPLPQGMGVRWPKV